jgi:hypothetical protein
MSHDRLGALVWLDAGQACIFLASEADLEAGRVRADAPSAHVRHEADATESGKVRDDRQFFEAILAALENAGPWLLAGPGRTKHDLEKYLDGHAEELRDRLVAVEDMQWLGDETLRAVAARLLNAAPHGAAPGRPGQSAGAVRR